MAIRAEIFQDLNFDGYNDLIQKAVLKRLGKIGYFIAKYAQNNHRYTVRTGNLKNSTRYWVNRARQRLRIYISEGQADYGKYVHEGHGTWAPDQFIDGAIAKNKKYIDEQLEEAIKEATGEWNRRNRL